MPRLPGFFTPLALAAPLLVGGCNRDQAGLNTAAAATSGPRADAGRDRADQGRPEGGQEKSVTPDKVIDTKQAAPVVKGEVRGGEAKKGPTPVDRLWQIPKVPPKEEEYALEPPNGLPPLSPNAQIPASNPLTVAKIELGKQLYFDPRLSKDGTVSCATCHNPEKGWTDQLPASIGIGGQTGARSAPTVLNAAYNGVQFWDGRAPSLEGQAQGPIQNAIEMGDQSYEEIVDRLREIPGYRDRFREVFGTDVTLDGLVKAIASFERTALSGNSAYDKYQRGDFRALTDAQKRGMVLFGLEVLRDEDGEPEFKTDVVLKKANCTSCHAGFNFTDNQFHNLGVGHDAKTGEFADLGRWVADPVGAKDVRDIGAFKTPTLRDLSRTAPYMHDGSEKTLEAVVDFYDRGGVGNPYLDKDIKKLDLTAQEKADLVAFLKALDGDAVKVELPKLPPGPDGRSPDPRAALTPPGPRTALDPVPRPIAR